LWEAFELTRGRRGNRQRLRRLIDSRDEARSAAERLCHRLLRDARLTGWEPNLPVRSGGRLYLLDVAFPGAGLVVEIDGRLHEDDPDVFENDRWRQNALVLDGWVVVRVTWAMLTTHPEAVLETIRAALAAARTTRPLTYRGPICREAAPHARRGRRSASRGRISGDAAQRAPR
jgi:very-short-patch-repair endonuclease